MRKFLKYIVVIVLIVSAVQIVVNLTFIYMITKDLPKYRNSVTLFKDQATNKNNERIAVITCSNGEFNLEFSEIRDSLKYPVDFYKFSGSTHFNFIDYLIQNKTVDLSMYNKVILYLPYIVYEESTTFQHRWGFYEITASRDYISYLIKENPFLLLTETWFYNYIDYKNTTKNFKIDKSSQKILTTTFKNRTDVVDSLIANKTSYFYNNQPFNRKRYINENEPDLINKVQLNEEMDWYVFLPPMPNIKENLKFQFNPEGNIKILNSYKTSIKDSSLCYDQWYHLNYKGRQIETSEFINSLHQLKICKTDK